MSHTLKKMRAFLAHPDTNLGKIDRLENLHVEYVSYVRICVRTMIDKRRLNLCQSEKQAFFPKAEDLTSQIIKNARDHAIQIVSTWAKGAHIRRVKKVITGLKREGEVINPAHTSQECPSCGYISRSNRSGVNFSCRSCGRQAHADWVGASGILRRSVDNGIGCVDRPNSVKATLRRRYIARRAGYSPARSSPVRGDHAPSPLGRSLTTEVSGIIQRVGTGSKSGSASFSRFG